jgi:DNA mismatch repair protein MSH4
MFSQFQANSAINHSKISSSIITPEENGNANKSMIFSTQQTTKRGTIGASNESANQENVLRRPFTNSINIRPDTAATSTRRPTTAGTNNRPPKRIMAIAEGRGVAVEVGICIFDINSCEVEISQVIYSIQIAYSLNIKNLHYVYR